MAPSKTSFKKKLVKKIAAPRSPTNHATTQKSPLPVYSISRKTHSFFWDSPVGIIVADPHTRSFHQVNPVMCEMFGYSEKEFCQIGVLDIHPPEDLKITVKRFKAMSAGQQTEARDIACLRKDGSIFFADIYARPMHLEIGDQVVGFFVDVTEKKLSDAKLHQREAHLAQALAELQQSETLFKTQFENSPDLIVLLDRNLRYLQINKPSYGRFKREDIIGQELHVPLPPHVVPLARKALEECLRSGTPQDLELELTPGQWRRTRAIPLFSQGMVDRIMIISTDISQQKRSEQHLSRLLELEIIARQAAVEANQTKDTFLATLSHELRTPLTAILSWAQMILRGSYDDERLMKALKVIEQNAKTQARLINDLLDLSRIVSGKMELNFHPVLVESVVRSAIESLEDEIKTAHLNFQTDFPAKPIEIVTDQLKFQQIVWNLLNNAIKFTPAGGTIGIHVEAAPNECCGTTGLGVKIDVSDTGCGIPVDKQEEIFIPFKQLDSGPKRSRSGLGLGLSICQKLVTAMGGKICVHSDGLGKGSCFSFCLPTCDNTATPLSKR